MNLSIAAASLGIGLEDLINDLGGDKAIERGAETLKALRDKIDITKMPKPSFMMVVTAVGTYAYKRADDVWIVPVGCLKD